MRTYRELVDANPWGWTISAATAGFFLGVFVTLGFLQVINRDHGLSGRQPGENTPVPSHTPILQLPTAATPTNPSILYSPTPTATESGKMEMTFQQFIRPYLDLNGRFAEQEAFLERANRKRVQWRVLFLFPKSSFIGVTAYFDPPAESPNERPLIGSPVRWANFQMNFHDR